MYYLEILNSDGWSYEIGDYNHFDEMDEISVAIDLFEKEVMRREEIVCFNWRILDESGDVVKLIENRYVGPGD